MSAGKRGNRIADSSGARYRHRASGGSSETVRRLTVHWHTERGRSGPPSKRQVSTPIPRGAPLAPATRPLSPRQARWLLLKPEGELKPEQRLYLEHLGRSYPEVLTAQQLVFTQDAMRRIRLRKEIADVWPPNPITTRLADTRSIAPAVDPAQTGWLIALACARTGATAGRAARAEQHVPAGP